jgi:hypothetical protein
MAYLEAGSKDDSRKEAVWESRRSVVFECGFYIVNRLMLSPRVD